MKYLSIRKFRAEITKECILWPKAGRYFGQPVVFVVKQNFRSGWWPSQTDRQIYLKSVFEPKLFYLYGVVILSINLCVYAFEMSPFTNCYLNKQNCFFNPIRANWTTKISFSNCMIGFCIKTLYHSQNWPQIISPGRCRVWWIKSFGVGLRYGVSKGWVRVKNIEGIREGIDPLPRFTTVLWPGYGQNWWKEKI